MARILNPADIVSATLKRHDHDRDDEANKDDNNDDGDHDDDIDDDGDEDGDDDDDDNNDDDAFTTRSIYNTFPGIQRDACHDELGSLRPSHASRRQNQPDLAGVCVCV